MPDPRLDPSVLFLTPERREVWIEHEVIDDELRSTSERIGQRDGAVGSIEDVCGVDFHHREMVRRRRVNSSRWRFDSSFSFASSA